MHLSRLSAVALAAAAALAAPAAFAHDTVWEASLSGANEAPPNASPGTGFARITFNDHDFTMRVEVTFADLLGTTTAAHIHCCTAVPGAGTAGVATQLPSFSGFPLGVTAGSYDNTFDMTLAASWNPAFVTANGGSTGAAFSALLFGFESGKAYLNIHSSVFGPGEIRGFPALVPEPDTYALMLAGLGLVGWAARRRS